MSTTNEPQFKIRKIQCNTSSSNNTSILTDSTNSINNNKANNNHNNNTIKRASIADYPYSNRLQAELQSSKRYQRIDKLGEGNYGAVYKARDLDDYDIVAMKKIKIDHDDEGVPSTALRECSLLQILRHPNIVPLKDIIFEPSYLNDNRNDNTNTKQSLLYLIFKHSDSDLRRFIDSIINESKHIPSLNMCKYIIYQMFDGLAYMHENSYLHRDLKPQNILVNLNECNIAIGDLGLSRQYVYPLHKYTHEIATLWYRAPEVLMNIECYTTAVDIWSIGCIIAELLYGIPLFSGDSEIGQLFIIFQTTGTPNTNNYPDCLLLPDYKVTFPQWSKKPVENRIRKLLKDKIEYITEHINETIHNTGELNDMDQYEQQQYIQNKIKDSIEPFNSMLQQSFNADAMELIEQCIVLNPTKRINALDALKHKFFADMNIESAKQEAIKYEQALEQRMAKRKK